MKAPLLLASLLLLGGTLHAQVEKPYRILVDKVFSRTNDRRIPAEDFAAIKAMGIQILSPRWGMTDGQSVERDLELCRKNGLYYLPWLRGTLENTTDTDWKLTTVEGKTSPLYSPNSEIFQSAFTKLILDSAKLPTPNLGIFLDFEHYPNPRIMEPYDYSYDPGTRALFTRQTQMDAKKNPKEFQEFQRQLWKKYFEELAKKLKKENPSFRFFVYPGLQTPFLQTFGQVMRAHGFEVNNAGAATYGRETFQSLAGAAEGLGTTIANAKKQTQKNIPGASYLAGLDPIEAGNTPQLLALKMKSAIKNGDGYWIFFEGFRRTDAVLPDYIQAITAANAEIDSGNLDLVNPAAEDGQTLPPIQFKRPDAPNKVFVSGEMRGAISKFYNQFPEYEAVNMTGQSLDTIAPFQLLVLQSLSIAPCDREKIYQTLRDYVKNGGSILFTFSSIESLPGIFPEIANGTATEIEPFELIDSRKVADKLRIFKQKKPFVDDLPFDKYSAYYLYCYPMQPGKDGAVVTHNLSRLPVCVAGTYGKGRIAFAGDYFGRREVPTAEEKDFFLSLSNYLTGRKAR